MACNVAAWLPSTAAWAPTTPCMALVNDLANFSLISEKLLPLSGTPWDSL